MNEHENENFLKLFNAYDVKDGALCTEILASMTREDADRATGALYNRALVEACLRMTRL